MYDYIMTPTGGHIIQSKNVPYDYNLDFSIITDEDTSSNCCPKGENGV